MPSSEFRPPRFGQLWTFAFEGRGDPSAPMMILGPGVDVLFIYPSGGQRTQMSGFYEDRPHIKGYKLILDTPKEGTR